MLILFGSSGKGFTVYSYDEVRGRFESRGQLGTGIERPTAFAASPDLRTLYVTSEVGNDGKVEASIYSFRLDMPSGTLQPLNKVMSGGGGTTFLAVDQTGRTLIANNFGGGQVATFRLNTDGSIGERSSFEQHPMTASPIGSHPHHTVIASDNRHVLVPDLGLDRIYTYLLDAKSGKLTAGTPPYLQMAQQLGPRHIALTPDERFAYVIDESEAAITRLEYAKKTGALTNPETISMLPAGFTGTKSGADLWIDSAGRFLYASDRSDNAVLVYAIDAKSGALKLVQRISSQGKAPRSVSADPNGQYLYVANQQSNNVVLFRIDAESGKLRESGINLIVPTPASIEFLATAKR